MNIIFDRNACLLPAYFIANEVQKGYPDGRNWPHWVRILLFSILFFLTIYIKI